MSDNTFPMRLLVVFVLMTYSRCIVLSAVASAAATMCVNDASSSSGSCIPYLLFFYLALLRELEYAIESCLALSLWHDLSSGKTEDVSHGSDFTEVGMLLEEAPIKVAINVVTEGAFR